MTERDIRIRRWTTPSDFSSGTWDGVGVSEAGLTGAGSWTSPPVRPGFPIAEVIPSFTASTPGPSWVRLEMRGTAPDGTITPWYALGDWAAEDSAIARTSVGGQPAVATDTLVADLVSWQIRITSTGSPTVHTIGAVASGHVDGDPARSTPGRALGVTLDVPQFSQKVHAGRYPQWDNGGESWCSPTSVSMVAAYWKTGPTESDYAWVDPDFADPWVIHAARGTYDRAYTGCGNWPFNTAYAGRFGLDAFVTRLRSLSEVEAFIDAGIPLVMSAAYAADQVPGADYATGGHLLVVVGFTETGDPVLNDPAAIDNAAVRKVFGRREFEAAWQRGSGGVAYVIRPLDVALPVRTDQPNW